MSKQILVISNGHGEDIIAAALLKELLSRTDDLTVRVLPIVGEGNAYKTLPVELLGPRAILPSGGFMRQSAGNFWADLRSGLLGHTRAQIRLLRRLRPEVDLVLAIGDVLLIILAGWFVGKSMVFVPTAKSEYISGHYHLETRLMRRYASLVLPRDAKTAGALRQAGVHAQFVGNAMMDSFTVHGLDFGIPQGRKVVGILPGSRREAYGNMAVILRIIEEMNGRQGESYTYLAALAEQISVEELAHAASPDWRMKGEEGLPTGVAAILQGPSQSEVKLVKGHFGDVLRRSDIFIGLAGTANEQAVGMGKPLVTFPGEGPQFNRKFLRAQKKLLGDSIAVVEPEAARVADELLAILHDPVRYAAMGRTGSERMGPPGGIGRMVECILFHLQMDHST